MEIDPLFSDVRSGHTLSMRALPCTFRASSEPSIQCSEKSRNGKRAHLYVSIKEGQELSW